MLEFSVVDHLAFLVYIIPFIEDLFGSYLSFLQINSTEVLKPRRNYSAVAVFTVL